MCAYIYTRTSHHKIQFCFSFFNYCNTVKRLTISNTVGRDPSLSSGTLQCRNSNSCHQNATRTYCTSSFITIFMYCLHSLQFFRYYNFMVSSRLFPSSLLEKTSFRSSSRLKLLYNSLPLTSSGSGPISSPEFGQWNAAIDMRSFFGFTTALCSMLLYFPLVYICRHEQKFIVLLYKKESPLKVNGAYNYYHQAVQPI